MAFPLPVTVLTGFLGSGKTTLLKALLADPSLSGTAVIVNEFGEVGLDDALVEAADEEMVMLPSGCVCCAVRGDLVAALKALADRAMGGEIGDLKRVVIETTGLADPAPIAHTLMTDDDLFRLYQLAGIVVTVDGELGLSQIDKHYEAAKQIAVADRVVITKGDRAGLEAIDALCLRVAALNPAATVVHAVSGKIAPAAIFDGGSAFEPAALRDRGVDWLSADAYHGAHGHAGDCSDPGCTHPDHDHDHHAAAGSAQKTAHDAAHLHGVRSFAMTFTEPLDGRKLSFALELLRSAHGDKLLRLKGIVAVAGEPLPFVIHGVQHVFYPPTTLESWPWEQGISKLVFITKDLDEAVVREILMPLFHDQGARAAQTDYTGWTAD